MQNDVDKLLQDTGLTSHTDEIRHWYDGYYSGRYDIYCPWDVMNHVKNLLLNPTALPASYWEHTSHNDIIYQFLSATGADVNEKFEALLSGGYIMEPIEPNLTIFCPNVSKDEVIRYCKMFNFHDNIVSMPEKFETMIDAKFNLSGGQLHKIARIRCFLTKPPPAEAQHHKLKHGFYTYELSRLRLY